ncbi:MAG TPA: hypothetical protein VLR50_18740 [Desulfobacterales bacterium]|nr:hypothetical protein [Desulfobacterales bacterium]
MEPVVFPRNVMPVTRADRVKRAKPREDRSEGSFAKHLQQGKEEQAGGDAAAEDGREQVAAETPGGSVSEVTTGSPRAGGFGVDEAAKKAIDIHV